MKTKLDEDQQDVVDRFLAGDTEDLDFHEGYHRNALVTAVQEQLETIGAVETVLWGCDTSEHPKLLEIAKILGMIDDDAAYPPLSVPEAALDEWHAQAERSGAAVYFPFGDPVAAAEAEYDIEIIDHGFEPDTYAGWNVQFQVKGLPRLSYQKQDPILDAFIPLERAPENALKLGTGSSSAALARTDEGEKLTTAMMGGGQEGNILRGFTGAAVVEVRPVTHGNAPTMLPPEDKLRAACRRSIDRHLAAVAEERKRLVVTETGDQVIGKKLKV